MKRKLLMLIVAVAIAVSSRAQTTPTHVTGTFKTPGNQTPAQAGLKQIATIGGTAVYGAADFVPYDAAGRKPFRLLCSGISFIPQKVRAWIKGDGTLIDNAGASGVDLIPTMGCQPSGLVALATIALAPSADGRVASVSWAETKEVPAQPSVDWGALPVAGPSAAKYEGYRLILDEGIALPARLTLNFIGPAVTCSDNSASGSTDCSFTGGGGGGTGFQLKINGALPAVTDPINFRDAGPVRWTNPSAGNIEANIAAGGITDAMLAGSIAASKIIGTAEVLTSKNAVNGYAGLDSSSRISRNQAPTNVVYSDSATTYAAGQRQTFTASSAAAGLSVASVPGQPSSPSNGDFINNAGTLQFYFGAVWYDFEFRNSKNQASGYAGLNSSGLVAYAQGGHGVLATLTDQVFISTSASAAAWFSIADCSNATTSKVLYSTSTHLFTCGTDQTGAGGSGITTLNGLTATVQSFSFVNDTNVTLSVGSSGSTHQFTVAWSGALAKARQHAATAYGDQAQTFTGLQTINPGTTPADALLVDMAQPGAAGQRDSHNFVIRGTAFDTAGHNADWRAFVDVTSNAAASTLRVQSRVDGGAFTDRVTVNDGGTVTASQFIGSLSGNASTASALALDPQDCGTGTYAQSIIASGNLGCNIVQFSQLGGTASVVVQSGTTAPDDNVLVASGSAWQPKALANCLDTGGQHLNYDATTNNFSCGTSGGAGGGISGSGTTNRIPVFTNTTVLGSSPFEMNGNHLRPIADATSDIGDATHQIRDVYYSGTLISSGVAAISGAPGVCSVALALQLKLCADNATNRWRSSYNGGPYSDFVLASDTVKSHTHQSASEGGTLDAVAIAAGTLANARLDSDLAALGDNATNGLWARTGAGTGAARTLTGTTNEVSISNGDGVSGNPTFSISATLDLSTKILQGGTPLVFEGATSNSFTTSLVVTDPTANRTFTLPNANSVAVQPNTCAGTDKVSAVSTLGVVTCSADQTTGGASGYATVQEEGTSLTQRTILNFIGSAITAADNSVSTRTDVTLSQSPSASTSVVGTGRTLTGGAGIAALGDLSADRTIATASGETDFLASGALTCGAATQGRMQVHTTPLQYCDNAATPALQYAAYGDSSGNALGVTTSGVGTSAIAAAAVTVAKVTAVLKTRQLGFIIGADDGPALVDTNDQATIFVNRLGQGIHITEVWCESDAGTPSVNLQRDDGTPANVLSASLSCSTSGASSTSFTSGEDAVADGDRIDFALVSAGGTAKRVTVYVKYTLD